MMTAYIALLRGINVGGKNKIKMVELRETLKGLNLVNVKTYIQSGNVVFKSNDKVNEIAKAMQRGIHYDFGVEIPVILRTADELNQIIKDFPFTEEEVIKVEAESGVSSLYVGMMRKESKKDVENSIVPYKGIKDEYKVIGKNVFLLFSHSIRDSKLARKLNKLETPITIRNWKTINKLSQMAGELDENN